MKSFLARTLAALLAGLTISGSALALTVTPHQPSLVIAPGSAATAEFDIDFGDLPLDFIALQLDIGFNVFRLSGDAEAVTLSFAGTEPQFNLGNFVRSNHVDGASISWVIGGVVVPQVSGIAVLSVPVTDIVGSGLTPLKLNMLLSTLDDNLEAGAQIDVVVNAVPEPQAWVLALLGGCGLVVMRRRAS